MYRHPNGDRIFCHEYLKKHLECLNRKGREVLIFGDINENFIRYNDNKQTYEYLDMPVIAKATRITDHTSSLIDHIYTNTPEKRIKSGICHADISYHLPISCTIDSTYLLLTFF